MRTAPPLVAGRPERAVRLLEEVEALRRAKPGVAWEKLARGFVPALRGASPARRGELWRVRGHVLRTLRRLVPAAEAYRRAERWYQRAGDMREVGRCAIGLVDTLAHLGRYRDAERVAAGGHRALSLAGDWAARARLLNNEGNLYHRIDRPDQALDRYRRARRALGRAHDARGQAIVDINIANCFSLLGRLPEARRLYQTSRRINAQQGFAVDALNAQYNLAYLEFLEHHHERALEDLEHVRVAAGERGIPALVALPALDRAEILLRLGAHEEALIEASTAAAAFQKLSMPYERAKAETFAALSEFRLGRRGAARARLERTLCVFITEGNAVWAGEVLVGLATLWWSEGLPKAAAPLLAAAVRRFAWARDREREGAVRALLARVWIESGHPGAAAVQVSRARMLARRRGSARVRHLVRLASAELARRRGDVDVARRQLRAAAGESQRLAARILDEQWRASFWGDWGLPHLELSALEMDQGRVGEAFEALEQGRGRVLASPSRSARHRALPKAVRAWAASRLARDRNRSCSEVLEEPVAPATPAPLRRLLERPWAPVKIRARELCAGLSADTLLIDFSLHRGSLSGFAVSRGGPRLVRGLVREAELLRIGHEVLFELRRAALQDSSARVLRPMLSRALSELASLALWPFLGRGDLPRTLAIVPVGPLARLPWAALPLPDGRSLGEATRIVVVPGLRVGLAHRTPARPSGAPLVVASPHGELENVVPEAEAVCRALPGAALLSGADATASEFLVRAAGAPWIHFAGHGLFQAGRAGLRLSDRWVLAHELEYSKWTAQCVVLSACQTARALVRPGEEWFGLARTMLLGGCRAVLAAQWDVEDGAAARFMTRVYERLRVGDPLGDAVSNTQAALSAAGAHPLDWAGFVVLGGPEAAAVHHRAAS